MHRSSKGFIIDASFIKLSTEKVGSFFNVKFKAVCYYEDFSINR